MSGASSAHRASSHHKQAWISGSSRILLISWTWSRNEERVRVVPAGCDASRRVHVGAYAIPIMVPAGTRRARIDGHVGAELRVPRTRCPSWDVADQASAASRHRNRTTCVSALLDVPAGTSCDGGCSPTSRTGHSVVLHRSLENFQGSVARSQLCVPRDRARPESAAHRPSETRSGKVPVPA